MKFLKRVTATVFCNLWMLPVDGMIFTVHGNEWAAGCSKQHRAMVDRDCAVADIQQHSGLVPASTGTPDQQY